LTKGAALSAPFGYSTYAKTHLAGEAMSIRPVVQENRAQPTYEGAGVHLHRAFGFGDPERMDPFLLFDDFRNEDPRDYLRGFPWHPHRGIETITYVLAGAVEHGDSLGNTGTLKGGDVQWMTAGSGILHQEMPRGNAKGQMHGFQLWANLPSQLKMTAPRYQDVKGRDIPEIMEDDGTVVKVIVGSFWGKTGPVDGIAADPQYLDIYVPPGQKKTFKVDTYRRAFAYVFEGKGSFRDASRPRGVLLEKEVMGQEVNIRDMSGDRTLIQFGTGDEVTVQAGDDGIRFLLISGAPIQEPVAWHGPIVMNTKAEIQQAIADLRNGTFIKPAH
jgi:redox-sensitive bicupin YhaK (pirin superfamily)